MKALILSDIHGNLPALTAVIDREKDYDLCLFLGDVVDYGPFPKECVHFLMDHMDYGVIGNHDNALANNEDCQCRGDFRKYSVETRAWHATLIDEKEKHFLRSLPTLQRIHLDEKSVLLAHATPQGDLFRYLTDAEVESAVEQVAEEIVLLGHTHIQVQRRIDDILIVNPGSVGLARDGGQACYAVLENGNVTLHRILYDVEKTIDALLQSPISTESKTGLSKVLRGMMT
jgi:putative phosphoesterase